jgi:hypothetical protein
MMLGIFFIIPMPAYLLESSIYCILFGMRAKNDNIGHTAHLEVQSVAM